MISLKQSSKNWTILTQFMVFFVGGLTTLLSARLFGSSKWGIIALLNTTIAISVVIGTLGIPTLIAVKFRKLRNSELVQLVAISASVVALTTITLAVLNFRNSNLGPQIDVSLAAFIFVVTFSGISNIVNESVLSSFQGNRKFRTLFLFRVLNVLLPGSLLVFAGAANTSTQFAIILMFFGTLISNSILLSYLLIFHRSRSSMILLEVRRASTSLFKIGVRSEQTVMNLLKDSFGFYLALTFLLIALRIDFFFTAHRLGNAGLASYSLSVLFAETAWLVSNGYSIYILPRYESEEDSNLPKKLSRYLVISLFLGLISSIVMGVIIGISSNVILGKDYGSVLKIYLSLLPGILALIPFKIIYTYLLRKNKIRPLVGASLIIIAVKSSLLLMSQAWLTLQRVSYLTSLAYVLASAFLVIYAYKDMTFSFKHSRHFSRNIGHSEGI